MNAGECIYCFAVMNCGMEFSPPEIVCYTNRIFQRIGARESYEYFFEADRLLRGKN